LRAGPTALAAPTASPPPQEAPVVAAEKIRTDIRYLASRELEGRGSGTPGGRKAGAFIADRFRAAGLQPLGADGSYRENLSCSAAKKAPGFSPPGSKSWPRPSADPEDPGDELAPLHGGQPLLSGKLSVIGAP